MAEYYTTMISELKVLNAELDGGFQNVAPSTPQRGPVQGTVDPFLANQPQQPVSVPGGAQAMQNAFSAVAAQPNTQPQAAHIDPMSGNKNGGGFAGFQQQFGNNQQSQFNNPFANLQAQVNETQAQGGVSDDDLPF